MQADVSRHQSRRRASPRFRCLRHRAGGRSSRAAVLSRLARSRLRGRDGVSRTAPRSGAPTSATSSRPPQTVIVTATVYNTDRPYSTECADPDRAQIARYAWGDDYHDVIGARLDALLAWMRAASEPFEARAYVDTGPVQERVYAQHAGVGWIGKNTCVISPDARLVDAFSAEIVCSLPLEVDEPALDQCGDVHAVPRSVSDARAGGARRARFDALHFVPDDRAARRIPDELGAASDRTSTAATSARKSARGTRRPRAPAIRRGSRARRGTRDRLDAVAR